MTTRRLTPLIVSFFAVVSPFSVEATVAKTSAVTARFPEKTDASENRALTLVKSKYKKFGKNVSGVRRECVEFAVAVAASGGAGSGAAGAGSGARDQSATLKLNANAVADGVTIVEREIRNANCGGASGNPVPIAKFVVRGAHVFIEDPVSNKLVAFDENFKSDGP